MLCHEVGGSLARPVPSCSGISHSLTCESSCRATRGVVAHAAAKTRMFGLPMGLSVAGLFWRSDNYFSSSSPAEIRRDMHGEQVRGAREAAEGRVY